MNPHRTPVHRSPRPATLHGLLVMSLWVRRRRRRRRLADVAALGERTMLDLGFDPDIVRAEAAKPFWRA
ncbi:MAG: hypothetical protein JNM30_00215 [Rhodospirillales bacterium]|nr:hypothetical protein [Rhodospirillales bacterium]